MTRSYAYALIMLATAILSSLVWLHFQLVEEALAEAYEFERETVKLAIEVGEERLYSQKRETDSRLGDPSKIKLGPIKDVLELAEKVRREVVEERELRGYDENDEPLDEENQRLMIHNLAGEIEQANNRLLVAVDRMLSKHGVDMDMNQDEVKKCCLRFLRI